MDDPIDDANDGVNSSRRRLLEPLIELTEPRISTCNNRSSQRPGELDSIIPNFDSFELLGDVGEVLPRDSIRRNGNPSERIHEADQLREGSRTEERTRFRCSFYEQRRNESRSS